MLGKKTIAECMNSKIISVKPDTDTIAAIIQLMEHKFTCAPVVDQAGKIVGMFSEADCMKVVLEAAYNQGMSGKVADFMNTQIISVDAKSSIDDLAEKFQKSSVRSFPVLKKGDLVGVVSRTDILKALVSTG